MKKLDSVAANTAVFYSAPDASIDPEDDLTIDHDMSTARYTGEANVLSRDASGTLFVSVGESVDAWRARRKGGGVSWVTN